MSTDIFRDFFWHSVTGPEPGVSGRRIVRSLPVTAANLERFRRIAKDGNLLIHKSSQALWKFSDDRKTIEPVFQEEILTEDKL